MGLKENIDAVKQEISTEEQFLESIIKGERFFKKYKKIILSGAAVLVCGLVVYGVADFIKQNRLEKSNQAYAKLLQNPSSNADLEILKDNNSKLYNLFLLSQAVQKADKEKLALLTKVEDPVISDIANYQLNSLDGKVEEKGELLRGMSFLQAGYKLLLDGKIDEAKLKFAQIGLNSPLKNIANNLEHYQGK